MVNVDKNIVPGKQAKSAKPKATARRPRNTALNSSKKLPDSIKNRRKQKLNCSREQVIDQLVNEEQIYTQEEAEELVSSFEEQTEATVERLATPEEVEKQDGEFWATKDGRTTLWCRGNGMWYDSGISAEDDALDSSKKLNCDASGISGAQDLLQKFVEDAASKFRTNLTLEWKPYSWKWSPEKKTIRYVIHDSDEDYTTSAITRSPSSAEKFAESVRTFIQKTVIPYLVDNAPEVDRIHGLFEDGNSYLELGDFSTDAPDVDKNDYDEELDNSKKLNSASGKYEPDNAKGLYPDNWLVRGEGSGTIEDDLPRAKRLFENWLTRAGSAYGIQLYLYTWYLADQDHGKGDIRRSLQVEFTDPEATGSNSPVNYDGPNAQEFYDDMAEFLDTQLFPAIKKEDPTVDMVFIMGGPVGYQEYELNSSKNSSGALNCSSGEPEGDADGGESIGEGVDASDIKITTESGNEVSMQDIKIVQNPDTNELAIFIPEDEDETIPEGFSVIGMVVPDMVDSVPTIEDVDDGEELDSSCNPAQKGRSPKKKESNAALNSAKDPESPFYTATDAAHYFLDKDYTVEQIEQYLKRKGYSDEWIRNMFDLMDECADEQADFDMFNSFQNTSELTEESVNSSLGGGDDRQDATSQVTVPKSFPDDKIYDLYRWVETELLHEGIDVDVYSVGRPSASTISFEFEVTGRDPAEVDAIIEDRVAEFVNNGNNAIQYPEGDPRSELNSAKQEKNLNCTVDNARVEQTEQGTWVVRADTDRFGENAILYEHYSEEGANKYLDRLKAGGDAVANGYSGHIDPKKVDLDSSDGTITAKLDKASISKAMAKVILEDKDTPLVYIKMKDGALVYLQPAGYEDNQLVSDGNFDDAKIYVAMYDKNFKPIRVDGKVDSKMNGSEVVDYIKRNLGM